MAMPAAPLEDIRGSCAAQPAGHNVNPRSSAEQPADGKDPTGSVAVSRDAQQGKRAVPDEGGEKQPKKICNHNLANVDDVAMPEILQPMREALDQEVEKYKNECEQWDPPNFEEDATEEKPTFRLRKVYERLCSIQARRCTDTPAQKNAVYALIKGLLAVLHDDVDSSAFSAYPKKLATANDLYADFCSQEKWTLGTHKVRSLEYLALAARRQMVDNQMDRLRHLPRYLKCLADFAELHDL